MTGFADEPTIQLLGAAEGASGAAESPAEVTLERDGWTLTLSGGLHDLPDLIARLQAAERLLGGAEDE